jgi:hypothetical protein
VLFDIFYRDMFCFFLQAGEDVAKKVMETQGGQCLEYLIKLAQKSITKKTFLKLFMICNRRNSIKQLEQLQFLVGFRCADPYTVLSFYLQCVHTNPPPLRTLYLFCKQDISFSFFIICYFSRKCTSAAQNLFIPIEF